MTERFPPPWRACHTDEAFWVEDSAGHRFAYTYFRDRPLIGTDPSYKLTRDQARRITTNIAKLPELLKSPPSPASSQEAGRTSPPGLRR